MLSPVQRSGLSVATYMLAGTLAGTQDLQACMLYTSPDKSLANFCGAESATEDKTRSVSQVLKLVEAKALKPEELRDYSIKVSTNLYLMDTISQTISPADSMKVASYVYGSIDSDLAIVDVSESIAEDMAQKMIGLSDCVGIVLNPDMKSVIKLQQWRDSQFWPKDKEIFYIIQNYDENIVAVREFCKKADIRVKSTCKLHHNPYVAKYVNMGLLQNVVPLTYTKDFRLTNLRGDMKEIVSYLNSVMHFRMKWEG